MAIFFVKVYSLRQVFSLNVSFNSDKPTFIYFSFRHHILWLDSHLFGRWDAEKSKSVFKSNLYGLDQKHPGIR
jgi:hypothetical protein